MALQSFCGETIALKDFQNIAFQIGTITNVEKIDSLLKQRLYKLSVAFNEKSTSDSFSAHLHHNYSKTSTLFQKQVIAVTNLSKQTFTEFPFNFHIPGFFDENGMHLLNTRNFEVKKEVYLDFSEKKGNIIDYNDFSKADIRAATVIKMEQRKDYLITVDIGGIFKNVIIKDLAESVKNSLVGSQVAVVVNLKKTPTDKWTTPTLLSFKIKDKTIPLGIDTPVRNGTSLL